jgi:uncharacterized protein YeeX (DUF496 family)
MEDGNNLKAIKISKLKAKQKAIESSWGKTGNPKLVQFLIDIIPNLLNVERCSLFVYNPDSDSLWLYRGTELVETEIQVPRLGSMVGEALTSGTHKIFTNLDDKAGPHELIDLKTNFSTINTLSLPIFSRTGERTIGVLQALNKKSRDGFTKVDVELMYRLADNVNKYIEPVFKHQEVTEILAKIKEKIRGLENSIAKDGIKKRLSEEQIASIQPHSSEEQTGRLH